ncbi:hypothetical protein BYT27DRAFT_6436036 [Phlegmacium glaucopus]|nr:hypothetical protein BYT27DRAFT_6436036 [Phlegmacium glaucopus]
MAQRPFIESFSRKEGSPDSLHSLSRLDQIKLPLVCRLCRMSLKPSCQRRDTCTEISLNMSQNRTTMATPFTLGPSPPSSTDLNATHDSSRLPLFYAISEKALRQQTRINRAETDLESSNAPALLVSAPRTHDPGSIPLNQPSLDLPPLSDPSDSSLPAEPQGPPRNQIGRMQTRYCLPLTIFICEYSRFLDVCIWRDQRKLRCAARISTQRIIEGRQAWLSQYLLPSLFMTSPGLLADGQSISFRLWF